MADEFRSVPLSGEQEMEPQLSRTCRRTYESIFCHAAAQNLEWRHLRALLNELVDVEEEPNGKRNVTRNGQTLGKTLRAKRDGLLPPPTECHQAIARLRVDARRVRTRC